MLLGFFLGALVGVAGMISGKLTRKDALPFAPYLVMATLVEVFWGETIWNWYMNLLQ
jgi:prepilin signal peptidase PulO-like enzyme (type II secretory pathway)